MDGLQGMEENGIGGTFINYIRFADETVLIADTMEKFQRLVDGLNEAWQRYGMKINIEKTVVMDVTKGSEPLTVRPK